jgi:hypothetical protein
MSAAAKAAADGTTLASTKRSDWSCVADVTCQKERHPLIFGFGRLQPDCGTVFHRENNSDCSFSIYHAKVADDIYELLKVVLVGLIPSPIRGAQNRKRRKD